MHIDNVAPLSITKHHRNTNKRVLEFKDSCCFAHTILLVIEQAYLEKAVNYKRKASNYRSLNYWMGKCPFSGYGSIYYNNARIDYRGSGGQSG